MNTTDLLPQLSPASCSGLDSAAADIGCGDFARLVARCKASDVHAQQQGGKRGWRPNGPGTLALGIALELLGL